MRSDPFSPEEVVVLQDMLAQLLAMDEKHGGWSSKIDARRSGFSLHVEFDKQVAVFESIEIASVFEHASIKLCQVLARVIDQLDAAAGQAASDAADIITATGA